MRASIKGSNGAICDKCGRKLVPDDIIKISAKKLDPSIPGGHYKNIGKLDLCYGCYFDIQTQFVRFTHPRR